MENPPETIRFVRVQYVEWLNALRMVCRLLYSLAIFGGATYLVFWRGESGWLYLLAVVLMWFRRGL